jgi:ABC-type dipeptide/oligopeptide/nickel transport system permease component
VFAFVIRRIVVAIPILILSTMLAFVLVTISGDPLEDLRQSQSPNKEQLIAARTEALNLNDPLPERYWNWITGVVRGDFGQNKVGQDVAPLLWGAMGITIRLVLAAVLLSIVIGVLVGVISALRQYTGFDYASTFLSFLFFAMPVFWFAVLLKQFGAIEINDWLQNPGIGLWGYIIGVLLVAGLVRSLKRGDEAKRMLFTAIAALGTFVGLLLADLWLSGQSFSRWIATVGPQTPNFEGSFWAQIGDYLGHMILPTITLAVVSSAVYSRFTRASMPETLKADYARTARAKGLKEKRVVGRHALRTGLIPITTLIALDFGAILAGAVITENVFGWKGMGSLFVNGLRTVDPYPVLGFMVVVGFSVIMFNLLADIAYAYLDPRIRLA